jgi:orotate phosphoribosyltransferase
MQHKVLELLSVRRGHFLFESGHHGDLWLDLESLCLNPRLVNEIASEISEFLAPLNVDLICGPLVEGAFVGLMVAMQSGVRFVYSERFLYPSSDGLFPAGYRLPAALKAEVDGKRIAIVNDVINAGSAVRGTYADLEECRATVVAIGALLVLGGAAPDFASSKNVPLKSVVVLPNNLWIEADCPLCRSGVPLEDLAGFSAVSARSQ